MLNKDTYRYERKYFIEDISIQEAKLVCMMHPIGFRPLFTPRIINNIYFDTLGFRDYTNNVEGDKNRTKVRIRWYGSLLGYKAEPVLEFKIKNGLMGEKKSYKLTPFNLDASFSRQTFSQVLQESNLPLPVQLELASLQPVLLNQYHRHYFLSFDKKIRLTLDNDLSFHKISFISPVALEKSLNKNTIILEMKYAKDYDVEARIASSTLPFRLTKSSKYVQGLDRLYTF